MAENVRFFLLECVFVSGNTPIVTLFRIETLWSRTSRTTRTCGGTRQAAAPGVGTLLLAPSGPEEPGARLSLHSIYSCPICYFLAGTVQSGPPKWSQSV